VIKFKFAAMTKYFIIRFILM